MSTTVQLRRYTLIEGEVDAFIEWFPSVVAVRELYSFRVLFAVLDRDARELTWAVAHEGDFDSAEAEYNASAERARITEHLPKRVLEANIAKVEVVLPIEL